MPLVSHPLPGGAAVEDCAPCTAGRYCADDTEEGHITGTPCPEGHYCPYSEEKGTPLPVVCPAGSYCKAGTEEPTPCPAGYVQRFSGAPYFPSPESYSPRTRPNPHVRSYCVAGTSDPVPCVFPFYCPAGSYESLSCPLGWQASELIGKFCPLCTPQNSLVSSVHSARLRTHW